MIAGTKGKLGGQSIEECVTADNRGKVADAKQKTLSKAGTVCTKTPTFGPTDPDLVNQVAVEKELLMMHEIFGSDLDGAIVVSNDPNIPNGKATAKCQLQVAKAAKKCQDAKVKAFNSCKKSGLKGKGGPPGADLPFDDASDLGRCRGFDPKGKVNKACEMKLGLVINKKCVGVDTSVAFPGCNTDDLGELQQCVDRIVECEACLALGGIDNLSPFGCDLIDDGVSNGSCGLSP